jgi:hypothetical protein
MQENKLMRTWQCKMHRGAKGTGHRAQGGKERGRKRGLWKSRMFTVVGTMAIPRFVENGLRGGRVEGVKFEEGAGECRGLGKRYRIKLLGS